MDLDELLSRIQSPLAAPRDATFPSMPFSMQTSGMSSQAPAISHPDQPMGDRKSSTKLSSSATTHPFRSSTWSGFCSQQ